MLRNNIRNIIVISIIAAGCSLISNRAGAKTEEYEVDLSNILLPSDTLLDDKAASSYLDNDEIYSNIQVDFIDPEHNSIINSDKLSPVFDTLCNSKRPLRILQIGDSHVAGKKLPQSIQHFIGDILGESPYEDKGMGVYFTYLAKNGATVQSFLTPERLEEIKSRRPDLIIASFGTNECHSLRYDKNVHLDALRNGIKEIHKVCPDATILLTTPPGDYLSNRTRYYVRRKRRYKYTHNPNPMTSKCASMICEFAKKEGLPVWDLNYIAGGDKAAENWSSHNLMQNDHVHFIADAYIFQGELFSEAFIKAYNQYIESINRQ